MDASRFSTDKNATGWVSVAVERTPQCNIHAGILWRDHQQSLSILHFAWHRKLKTLAVAAYRGNPSCATPPLTPAQAEWLAGFCGRIGRCARNRFIPYNLKYDPDVSFDTASGAIRFGPGLNGMNCATFVMTVFRSAGHNLIDLSDWPETARPTDIPVQERLVEELRKGNADERSQAQLLEPEIRSRRIAPEEVAGACTVAHPLPTGFSECEANGREIVRLIDAAAQSAVPPPHTPAPAAATQAPPAVGP